MPLAIVAFVCLLLGAVIGGATCSRQDKKATAPQEEVTPQAQPQKKPHTKKGPVQQTPEVVSEPEGKPNNTELEPATEPTGTGENGAGEII